MNRHKRWLERWLVGFTLLLLVVTGSYAKEIDEETGLIIDDNVEVVKTYCTVCHSAKNITGQTGSRLTWLGLIRWMQNTQGLQTFDADTEKKILDYLETNYSPTGENYRRAAISPFLMPPNPYLTQATIKFVGLEQAYQVGGPLKVSLAIDFQEFYSKGFLDLWVAAHFPDTPASQYRFVTGPIATPSFLENPQPLKTSLESTNDTSLLMDFIVPSTDKGEYTFYALLVERGANPLNESDRSRSNLVIQKTNVE
jgi:hypothetical protein